MRSTLQRLEVVKVRERTEEYGDVLKNSTDVVKVMREVVWSKGEPCQEEIWVLPLTTRTRMLGARMVGRGTGTECPVEPRDVFMVPILVGATNVILVHCHPSGDPTPSSEDRLLTIRMKEAGRLLGVKLLDHIIVGSEQHYSFNDDGLI